jgi:hypothetical protein
MARDFQEQLENEVNLDELNKMTEARSKPAAPVYPAPPPEFGGEPISTPAAADVTPSADVAPADDATLASAEATPESYAPPDPGSTIPPEDASHNDLSENHEQRHERGA